jgi:4-hydroxybenzoate polyprenyltransferase
MKNIIHIIDAFRIGRIIMLSLVTGSTTYCFGGSGKNVILSTLFGACLALAGFYLDSLLDRQKDKAGGKKSNPFVTGELSVKTGYLLMLISIGICIAIAMTVNPYILLPCFGVMLTVLGLNKGILDTPILSAVSLGCIQALYVLAGGMFAQSIGQGVMLTALFLLFAMTGGRVIGDVRDLPYDTTVDTITIPIKYGIVFTRVFLWVNELIAYGLGIAVYLVEDLRIGYLYSILAIAVCGSIINLLFTAKPEPKVAVFANRMSLGILGSFFVLAMILGRH